MSFVLVGLRGFSPSASVLSVPIGSSLTLGRKHTLDSSKNVSRTHVDIELSTSGLVMRPRSVNRPLVRRGSDVWASQDEERLEAGDEIELIVTGEYAWRVERQDEEKKRQRDTSVEERPVKRQRTEEVEQSEPVVKEKQQMESVKEEKVIQKKEEVERLTLRQKEETDPRTLLKSTTTIYLPVLFSPSLSQSRSKSIAEESMENYLGEKKLIIAPPTATASDHINRILSSKCSAVVFDVTWRWRPASSFSRSLLSPSLSQSLTQRLKQKYGATAKPGECYILDRSEASQGDSASLPDCVRILLFVFSHSKGDANEAKVEENEVEETETVKEVRSQYKAVLATLEGKTN